MKFYHWSFALLLLAACSKSKTTAPTNFKVDEGQSAVEWKGSAPDHFHTGAFRVSGTFNTNDSGKVTAGSFSIPIASITNFDVADPATQKQLLDHLKSPDFFNLAIHPDAVFRITKVEDLKETMSSANAKVTGDFTMIGQTHGISFPATILKQGNQISVQGAFKLNRLQWGMNSFNDPAAPLYILPEVNITLKIYGKPLEK